MEHEQIYQTEVTKMRHTNYVRNSRAITVVWCIFTICFAILNIVAFLQPQWLGDTEESPGVGFFGLYEYCDRVQLGDYSCRGSFLDFGSILNDWFRASSFLVGICALLFITSTICILLFCFLKAATVLKICGWMQFIGAICIAVGCIIFPNAWKDDSVRRICGSDTMAYNPGRCNIRWAYILSIVLIFDAFILAALAFVLSAKQAKLIPEIETKKHKRAVVNGGFSGDNTVEKRPVGSQSDQPVVVASTYDDVEFMAPAAQEQQQTEDFRL